MTRPLASRLAAIEIAASGSGPLVAFPDRADGEPQAFDIERVRYRRQSGETPGALVRRIAARVRPGARVVVWPLPMRPEAVS